MRRSLRAFVLAAACLIGSDRALAQTIPVDEPSFTKFVAEQLRKAVGAPVQIKGPLTLSIGETQANLDRIYVFCKKNAAGCAQEVDTYVNAIAEYHQDRERGTAPTKSAVRVIVRTTQYLQQGVKASGKAPLVARPLVEGLVVLSVLDMPRAIRTITDKDGAALGLTESQVYDLGVANLRKTLKPLMEVAKAAGSMQIGSLTGDFFHPSRIVLVDSWAPLVKAQGGVLIVAAPTTDVVLYIGEDNPIAIGVLRALVGKVMSRAPNPLSDVLLRWTPKGWTVVS